MIPDGKIRFESISGGHDAIDDNPNGYLDIASKKIIPCTFNYGGNHKKSLWFDPVSKLAYADKYLGKTRMGFL